jgi:hypothetical protein
MATVKTSGWSLHRPVFSPKKDYLWGSNLTIPGPIAHEVSPSGDATAVALGRCRCGVSWKSSGKSRAHCGSCCTGPGMIMRKSGSDDNKVSQRSGQIHLKTCAICYLQVRCTPTRSEANTNGHENFACDCLRPAKHWYTKSHPICPFRIAAKTREPDAC